MGNNGIKAVFNFYSILIGFLLIQQYVLCKPIDDSILKFKGLNEDDPLIKIDENFAQYYATHAANATRHLLKDESVVVNHNVEVEEFKKNLTTLLDVYDMAKNVENYVYVLDNFLDVNKYYFELPEKDMTPNSKFIVDMLTKYDCKKIYDHLSAIGKMYAEIIARALAEALFGWIKL